MMALTERTIQRCIYMLNNKRFRVLLPNYTPLGWWECDLFGVTKAGYFHEFEIKLTVADFRRDSQKKRHDIRAWNNETGQIEVTTPGARKHSLIGQAPGPSRFWYVVSEDMAGMGDVPSWAGLQVILDNNSGWARVVKQAPQLHKAKIDDRVVRHALSVCYWRYWRERKAFDRATEDRLPPSAAQRQE